MLNKLRLSIYMKEYLPYVLNEHSIFIIFYWKNYCAEQEGPEPTPTLIPLIPL